MTKAINPFEMPIEQVDAMFAEHAKTAAERATDRLEFLVGQQFCEKHPEYVPSAGTGALIENFIHAMGWPVSVDSVEKAYEILKREGSIR